MTESELRLLVSRSREDGFRQIFQQYKGYVYSIVWNRISGVGTREDAEECTSDIFSHVFVYFDRIEEGKLQSFIRTVTKRKAIDAYRRLSSMPDTISIEEQEMQGILSDTDIERDYEILTLRKVLLDKIDALGEPDSTIIMMKYFYERKNTEIAIAVHMNPVSIKMRINRAMKRLKKMLNDENISL